MKLKNLNTSKWTKIGVDEIGQPDVEAAADRLIRREMPGYFPIGVSYVPEYYRAGWQFTAEIVRGIGGLTEHTGETATFRVIK